VPEPPPLLEPRWHVTIAVVAGIVLYVTLPSRFVVGSGVSGEFARWSVPVLEALLLVPLAATAPHRREEESGVRRKATMILTGILSVANAISLGLLVHQLLIGSKMTGQVLFHGAAAIWLTNVIVFGLWFWLLDRGGPGARAAGIADPPDFLFPQMTSPDVAPSTWRALFADYLYVAFTNGTAFSPTDVLPLTHWAKLLMAMQSGLSLVTIALVAARAVNILH
jgi:hypothetical protein